MPASVSRTGNWQSLAFCAGIVCGFGAITADQAAGEVMRESASLPPVRLGTGNQVPGCVTPQRLMAFLKAKNRNLSQRYTDLARHYATYGARIGVRWDLGFLQMMLETANLTFQRPDGTPQDVAPEHNNFAGIGAIGDGRPGEIFATQIQGVRAHLEHVLHYSGVILPAPVAERTRKVQHWRVLAEWHKSFTRPVTYTDLAIRWASHSIAYRIGIEQLATTFQNVYCDGRQVLMVGPKRRGPSVAETAWRFERADGQPGMAGVTPPTGRPNLTEHRGTLGAGAIVTAADAHPPVPTFRPQMPVTRAKPVARAKVAGPAARPSRAKAHIDKRTEAAVRHRDGLQSRAGTANFLSSAISEDVRVRQLVSDRKILLRTHVGTTIPIMFEGNGDMRGEAGSLAFFLGSSRDKGRWWIANGKLCQKWRIWLDRDTYCMTLKERGGTIWWQADDGKSGTARIVQN